MAAINRRNTPARVRLPINARRKQVAGHVHRVMQGRAKPHPQFRFTLHHRQIGTRNTPFLRVSNRVGREVHEFRLTTEQERQITERWSRLRQSDRTKKNIKGTIVRTVALNPDVIAHGLKEILLHL